MSDSKKHTHIHSDGTTHTHNHSHTHDPEDIKKIVNKLKRTQGHLNRVIDMIERNEDCSDVLVQLAAVKGEIKNAGNQLLKEHIEHCIVEAATEGDTEAIDKMNKAIDQFMK